MNPKPSPSVRNVENDPQLLFWFAMVLMSAIFIWSYFITPRLHQPGWFILYAALFATHIFLHFQVSWVDKNRRWLFPYVILQGLLAFGVTYLSHNVAMVFCLFMGLAGELLAIFKITVAGVLIALYLLLMAFASFVLMVGVRQAGWFALGTIPTLIFVGIYVILFSRQAEANARAKALLAELEIVNRQLSDYAAQVEDLTLAAERQRMARELHDTLSQGLAGLILQLEAVDAHLDNRRLARARSIVQQSMTNARKTLAEARQAIDNLRKPAEMGLAERVRLQVEHFSAMSGIQFQPQIDLNEEPAEPVTEAAAKAVAESLSNITRHAGAKTVSLRMSGGVNELDIEIRDDGKGFEPALVQAGHYGLLGMQERIRLAGGELEIQSRPGEGTCVHIHFPCPPDLKKAGADLP